MNRTDYHRMIETPQMLDYGVYLDVSKLLDCQKPLAEMCNADELQFQIVHQVEELWMKLMAYTLVDVDVRYVIAEGPTGGDVALQLNLTNLFDEYYVGYFGGSLNGESFAQIGAPRAGSLSLSVGF